MYNFQPVTHHSFMCKLYDGGEKGLRFGILYRMSRHFTPCCLSPLRSNSNKYHQVFISSSQNRLSTNWIATATHFSNPPPPQLKVEPHNKPDSQGLAVPVLPSSRPHVLDVFGIFAVKQDQQQSQRAQRQYQGNIPQVSCSI